mmetsp:Transcript_68888/g.199861  ORF Transcript_68888/g.199861 Transcript_68888/m.199861 type:complete len:129 (+) Transcript_68888:278-664(+)
MMILMSTCTNTKATTMMTLMAVADEAESESDRPEVEHKRTKPLLVRLNIPFDFRTSFGKLLICVVLSQTFQSISALLRFRCLRGGVAGPPRLCRKRLLKIQGLPRSVLRKWPSYWNFKRWLKPMSQLD